MSRFAWCLVRRNRSPERLVSRSSVEDPRLFSVAAESECLSAIGPHAWRCLVRRADEHRPWQTGLLQWRTGPSSLPGERFGGPAVFKLHAGRHERAGGGVVPFNTPLETDHRGRVSRQGRWRFCGWHGSSRASPCGTGGKRRSHREIDSKLARRLSCCAARARRRRPVRQGPRRPGSLRGSPAESFR